MGNCLEELCGEVSPSHVCLLLPLSPSGLVSVRRPQEQKQDFPFYHWLNIFGLQLQWQLV